MKKQVIIFDFDKTLTYNDTLFGFYKAASRSGFLFRVKYPFFLLVALAFKLGLISNSALKKTGVWFYLKGFSREELEKKGKEYASKIELNNVYKDEFLNYPADQVMIISASFEAYLKPLFPKHRVIGSKINYEDDSVVSGISVNMYGAKKREWLEENGIRKVDLLYTDSLSDAPVIEISKHVMMVEGDKIRKYK